jgi:integrase
LGKLITDREMLSKPSGVDRWFTEGGPRGAGRLMGRVTASGERLFYFRYTLGNGARDTLLIGHYSNKPNDGGLTLSAARAKALAWSGLIQPSSGEMQPVQNRDIRAYLAEQERLSAKARIDAQALERNAVEAARLADEDARRMDVTLRAVFDQWRLTALTPRLNADGRRMGRKDGGQYVTEQFVRHVFPLLGETPMAKIRKPQVFGILDDLVARGKLRTANVILADLKQLFRFAVDREIVIASPVESIKKERVGGSDTERERTLDESEICALASQMAQANLSKRTALGLWLTLATGVRAGELVGAVWSDHRRTAAELAHFADARDVKFGVVDLKERKWHILSTKNQRGHTIHLSAFALNQFIELSKLREHDDWIFPDKSNMGPVGVKSFGKQFADRQRVAGKAMTNRSAAVDALMLSGGKWTAHDLRRTAATLMAKMGIGNDVINECLNHKQQDRMTRVYVQDRRLAEQALAFEKLGEKIALLCKVD